jgi:predicted Rdx family selenoprotein
MESDLGIPVRLRVGRPGALDIFVEGEQIYSLKQSGRMPVPDELIKTLRTKLAQA